MPTMEFLNSTPESGRGLQQNTQVDDEVYNYFTYSPLENEACQFVYRNHDILTWKSMISIDVSKTFISFLWCFCFIRLIITIYQMHLFFLLYQPFKQKKPIFQKTRFKQPKTKPQFSIKKIKENTLI